MSALRLAHPLVLLLLIPMLILAWWLWRRASRPRMNFSAVGLTDGAPATWRMRLLRLPLAVYLIVCALTILAMARPQAVSREHHNQTEGIDIVLVIDVSGSMRALDFQPNRLEKAKAVVQDFIAGRENDRLGVVIFGSDAFTLTPLTFDMQALHQFIDRIDFDLIGGESTAIGMGLANAVSRLEQSTAKSKVVILLTDGENNAGRIDPLTAAGMAKAFGIRVYTIGVGSDSGTVPIPATDAFNRPVIIQQEARLDVKQLTAIAQTTGGEFFHATDGQSLETIYRQIDRMERTRFEASETHAYDDLGHFLILPALGLLLFGFALEQSWLRTFP